MALHVTAGDPKNPSDWKMYEVEFPKRGLKDIKRKFAKLKRSGTLEQLDALECLDEDELKRLVPSWGD